MHRNVRLAGVDPSQWRVRVAWLPDKQGILVLGLPMTQFQEMSDRLIRVEVIATASVMLVVALVVLRVVRVGMRPLDRIAEVAADIGDGDLNRRVRPPGPTPRSVGSATR